MNYLIQTLISRKVKLNFRAFKFKAGSVIALSKYEMLLEKKDLFGLRIGNLNLKKLRLNKFGLVLLKMIRRLNRLFYKKTVRLSEISYNFLWNEGLKDRVEVGYLSGVVPNDRLGVYNGIIYHKSDLFRIYVFRLLNVKNVASNVASLFGYFGNSRLRFNFRSPRIYNSIALFGLVKKNG